jgi:hypothetical protein
MVASLAVDISSGMQGEVWAAAPQLRWQGIELLNRKSAEVHPGVCDRNVMLTQPLHLCVIGSVTAVLLLPARGLLGRCSPTRSG